MGNTAMEKNSQISIRILLLLAAALLQSPIILAFIPTSNFLLDCGATSPATLNDRRAFLSDESDFLSSWKSHGISDPHPSDAIPAIYRSARVFCGSASYLFRFESWNPLYFIRLHFYALNSSSFDLSAARFHVTAGESVLLSNFSLAAEGIHPIMKEFILKVEFNNLTITFIPADGSSIAFVNAIEVFSAPGDLISDFAWSKSNNNFKNWSILEQPVESLYRINIGGGKITPFKDTLLRNWAVDDTEFLQPATSPSRIHTISGKIEYTKGGASREVAPDDVYRSSRVTNSSMTWIFPVNSDHKLLTRLHFCDIVSSSLNQLYFNISINGEIFYIDFDLSKATSHKLLSPRYIDFVVNSGRRTLKIGIIPSNHQFPTNHLGLLNGLEIFKINYTSGSDEINYKDKRKDFILKVLTIPFVLASFFVMVLLGASEEIEMQQAWLPLTVLDGDEENEWNINLKETRTSQAWSPYSVLDDDEENYGCGDENAASLVGFECS